MTQKQLFSFSLFTGALTGVLGIGMVIQLNRHGSDAVIISLICLAIAGSILSGTLAVRNRPSTWSKQK
ncbi:hypothetical protein ALI44B_00730 [Leifsonia sp. ALI-44-B]|uniref:hypothetical protein n=1 Tax=Leifsonia sp. ALI-44-B TaxID=1933776 RepID=UPI00097CB436|nr:hypothetical protein [Leifsonia sp. ALI-44-B]ONI65250.1 hypothetical protein ALI44B_00730 [Leifsonia sp. ALI-44-B]